MTVFALPSSPRLLISAELTPLQGQRFQPTGFPDVGAGTFKAPNGQEFLAVESHQSVANRLEAACWNEATEELVAPLNGLSYVRVMDGENNLLTTSVLEAHRLNSVYIEKSDFFDSLKADIEFDEKRPFSRDKLVKALLKYDVGCLLHGVFLESIAGVLRLPRALSGFIEAEDISRVQTGGVKNDRVQAKKDEEGGKTAKDGFGNVPFHRTDFVAKKITAYFNLDVDQLRSYRLGADINALLFALAVFKVRVFLASGLRLRTACDLEAHDIVVRGGGSLPSLAEAEAALPGLIKKVAATGVFATPAVSVATFSYDGKTAKQGKKK
jgi:CRISPR-associated protein Csb1